MHTFGKKRAYKFLNLFWKIVVVIIVIILNLDLILIIRFASFPVVSLTLTVTPLPYRLHVVSNLLIIGSIEGYRERKEVNSE